VILGASGDSVESHRKFKEKYDLPYTLLADESHEIAQAYGVWEQKSMFGKKYMGIPRTTFLIAPDGRIARVFEKVNPLGHAAQVAEAIEALR
jgi:peroxiredoxin Q/BCP